MGTELAPIAPIALTIFNRPEDTRRTFETIRRAKPPKLFLIADAGRNEKEHADCIAARAVVENVDWECEVFKNYADTNMGARMRLATGITWVFEHTDRAIILEHDCVPHPDFFTFCNELLEKYKDDERVMHIGGNHFQEHNPKFHCDESYYFTLIPHIWGWATWARAWKHYDVNVATYPQVLKEGLLREIFTDPAIADRWEYVIGRYYKHEVESWDGQWAFACLINHGLCINPRVNMVTNIGFGPEALSTKDPNHKFANMPAEGLTFPLMHPTHIATNPIADAYVAKYCFDINARVSDRIRWFIKHNVPLLYSLLRKKRNN